MSIAELLRGAALIAWAPEELGAGGDGGAADMGTADKGGADPAGDVAKSGADAGAEATAGKDAAPGDGKPPATGSNSGKTAEEVIADLALSDETKGKLLAALPKDAQDRASKWLKTRSSLPDLLKAGLGADSKISELTAQLKGAVRVPGKDAKPDEIAAWRKAVGVPEAPDKYAVFRPEGFEPTEFDQGAEKTLLEAAHAADLNQRQVDTVLKTHYLIQAQQQKAMEDKARAAGEAAVEDLRVEFGRDYKANVTLADRWLTEHLGPDMGDEWKGLMGKRFADGTALGENPGFVKAIVKLAKDWADDGAVLLSDTGGATDIDAEIKGMMGKVGSDEYKSKAFQEKLDGLIAIQQKRKRAA